MEKLDISIRTATPDDAEGLLAIYAQYVENTAVTFEFSVPSEAEFRRRIENTLKKYPYLVAVSQGEIVGYAYAGEFKAREAYAYSVEISVYVKQGLTRSGIGRELYTVLEKALKAQNIVNVNACITYPEIEDEYVSKNSRGEDHRPAEGSDFADCPGTGKISSDLQALKGRRDRGTDS